MFYDPEMLSEAATELLSHRDLGAPNRSEVTAAVEQVWLAWQEMKRYGQHLGECDHLGQFGMCMTHVLVRDARQAAMDAAVDRLRALMMVGSPGGPGNAGVATSEVTDSTGSVVPKLGPDRPSAEGPGQPEVQ